MGITLAYGTRHILESFPIIKASSVCQNEIILLTYDYPPIPASRALRIVSLYLSDCEPLPSPYLVMAASSSPKISQIFSSFEALIPAEGLSTCCNDSRGLENDRCRFRILRFSAASKARARRGLEIGFAGCVGWALILMRRPSWPSVCGLYCVLAIVGACKACKRTSDRSTAWAGEREMRKEAREVSQSEMRLIKREYGRVRAKSRDQTY